MKRMIVYFGLVLVVIVIGMANVGSHRHDPGPGEYFAAMSTGRGHRQADIDFIIAYVFKGGPAPCPFRLGDVNCDDRVNAGDAVYLANYLFKGGPARPARRPIRMILRTLRR